MIFVSTAANVASQWLDLLQHDINGRLGGMLNMKSCTLLKIKNLSCQPCIICCYYFLQHYDAVRKEFDLLFKQSCLFLFPENFLIIRRMILILGRFPSLLHQWMQQQTCTKLNGAHCLIRWKMHFWVKRGNWYVLQNLSCLPKCIYISVQKDLLKIILV